jgi:N6-adenosine-specific RNA methylase IME4/ParB-like chromosome segregation protein Spo0J
MQILQELESLIPPLSNEEFKQLERNILEEGIREPLITWNGILIDGHNRYRIAQEHDINYETLEKEFENINRVKEWMINNQFGRRNLSNYQRSVLALQLEDVFREKAKENQGNRNDIKQISAESKPIETRQEIAKVANVSHDTIAKVKKIEAVATPEVKARLNTGTMSINEAYKEIKKEEIELKRKEIRETFEKQDVEIKDKKYRIIYADPPWKYGNAMPEYVTEPQDYYLLMNTEDICAMPIKDITEKDAVLFLWSTSPHLPEALEVAKAWGFSYKTTFIWDKIKHNMGHYNSVRHEILLVCTKGACTPDVKRLFDSVVSEERTEHSKKPNVFREIIETIYTYGNKIELFARETPEGWDVFGNQSNN